MKKSLPNIIKNKQMKTRINELILNIILLSQAECATLCVKTSDSNKKTKTRNNEKCKLNNYVTPKTQIAVLMF